MLSSFILQNYCSINHTLQDFATHFESYLGFISDEHSEVHFSRVLGELSSPFTFCGEGCTGGGEGAPTNLVLTEGCTRGRARVYQGCGFYWPLGYSISTWNGNAHYYIDNLQFGDVEKTTTNVDMQIWPPIKTFWPETDSQVLQSLILSIILLPKKTSLNFSG